MATLISVVNAGGSDHPVEITSGTESVVLVPGQTSQSFEVPEGGELKVFNRPDHLAPPETPPVTAA